MSLTTYLHSQLAATGFCIVDASMAYLLRPDLFSDASAASGAIMTARKRGAIKAANATEHVVELKGRAGGLQLLARFTDGLEARIAETTGLTVTAIRSPARLPQGMRKACASTWPSRTPIESARRKSPSSANWPIRNCRPTTVRFESRFWRRGATSRIWASL